MSSCGSTSENSALSQRLSSKISRGGAPVRREKRPLTGINGIIGQTFTGFPNGRLRVRVPFPAPKPQVRKFSGLGFFGLKEKSRGLSSVRGEIV